MSKNQREKLALHEKILNGMPLILSACDAGFLKRTSYKKANDKILEKLKKCNYKIPKPIYSK
jgi:hypothetical protein